MLAKADIIILGLHPTGEGVAWKMNHPSPSLACNLARVGMERALLGHPVFHFESA